jgi:hypothetical protein
MWLTIGVCYASPVCNYCYGMVHTLSLHLAGFPAPTIAPSITNKAHMDGCALTLVTYPVKPSDLVPPLLELTSIHEYQVVIILHVCLIAYNQIQ